MKNRMLSRCLPLYLALTVSVPCSVAHTGSIPEVGAPECVGNCGGDSGREEQIHRPEPAGPTPEQREQARARALKEANERGVGCFQRKEWNCAIRNFQEALAYAPYNPSLQHNLKRAREEAARQSGLAGQQLLSTVHHGNQAWQSGNSATGRPLSGQGFDTGGTNAGTLPPPVVYNQYYGYRDPVVAPDKRTPAIDRFERERDSSRKKRAELEIRLNELQKVPKTNPVELVRVKQEVSNARNQENFLNFSIQMELQKAGAPHGKK